MSQFQQLSRWERSFVDNWQVRGEVPARALQSPVQIVLHLYSGHRREGDYQWWMEGFLASSHPNMIFLSVDTAIDDRFDVLQGRLWSFLMDAALQGALVAMVCGPPCESWSAVLRDEHGHQLRGPRQLRDRSNPWGVPELSFSCYEHSYWPQERQIKALVSSSSALVFPLIPPWHLFGTQRW